LILLAGLGPLGLFGAFAFLGCFIPRPLLDHLLGLFDPCQPGFAPLQFLR
jgi:hypothetical protein